LTWERIGMKICHIVLSLLVFHAVDVRGQGPFQAMNPNIGVIGDFSYRNRFNVTGPEDGFHFNEAEISFRMVLDPFARADFYVAVVPEEGVELEEGFLTLLSLPFSFQARVGHFRNAFGKFNLTHPPETPLALPPLHLANYFGEEGLAETGISVSTIVPNPWGIYLETSLDVLNGDNPVSFGSAIGDRPSYLAHLKSFVDVTENSNVEFGLSALTGSHGSPETHTTRLFGGDAIYRWKPLGRGNYRSFTFQWEGLASLRQGEGETVESFALFVFSQLQLSKRWFVGVSYDRSGLPESQNSIEWRTSGLVTFWPSEFQTVKVQVAHARRNFSSSRTVNSVHFQWTFVIGAHGAHKF
ncbi:MAG: hypothetical protein ACE5HZ_07060, partial [Fidelibacterota bacterium]